MVVGTGIGGIGMISDGILTLANRGTGPRLAVPAAAHDPGRRLGHGRHPVRHPRAEPGRGQRLRDRRPRHRRGDGGDRARPGGPDAGRRHRGGDRAASRSPASARCRPSARPIDPDTGDYDPDDRSRARSTQRATASSCPRDRRCWCSRSSSTRGRGARRRSPRWSATAPSPTRSTWRRRPRRGEGNQRAMRAALERAGIGPEAVDYINAHGTSTPLNDRYESVAIEAVFGDHAERAGGQLHQEHDRPHDGCRRRVRGVRLRQGRRRPAASRRRSTCATPIPS